MIDLASRQLDERKYNLGEENDYLSLRPLRLKLIVFDERKERGFIVWDAGEKKGTIEVVRKMDARRMQAAYSSSDSPSNAIHWIL